jgi:hypothetical protein
MGAQLRVVLDQITTVVDANQAQAARDLVAGLVSTFAPAGTMASTVQPDGAVDTSPATRSRAAWA